MISTWYTRKEQQLRFAFLQSGEVTIVGLGGILNYGLNHLDGRGGLEGWRWMFLVQGLIAIGKMFSWSRYDMADLEIVIGIVTYWWIVDFPEKSGKSFYFLTAAEQDWAKARITLDRGDVDAERFSWAKCLVHFKDPKLYGFCSLFFCL